MNIPVIYRPTALLVYVAILITAGCAQNSMLEKPPALSQKERLRFERQAKYIQPDFASSTQVAKKRSYESIWERIFALYALPEISHPRIEQELKWFLKNPDYIARIQERAEPYLYNIVEEIENNDLPGEIALLPVIESAFRPDAYSPAQAAGLWQFIPATGRLFGLKQNWWYDGRRDVFASTQAAMAFLKDLEETFDGDWLLALASYNAGKGTVGRAVERNREKNLSTDFWSLSLPQETQSYVPRLLAVAKLFARADHYNIELRPIPNKPVFEPVDIGSQIDLTKAAEMANLTIDDLYKLNPGFNRTCTDPNGPHRLLIPVEQVDSFKESLAQLSEEERVNWDKHLVQPGETLASIAQRYRTSPEAIRHSNQLKGDQLVLGSYLIIPPRQHTGLNPYFSSILQAEVDRAYAEKKKAAVLAKAESQKVPVHSYTVKPGDTFWQVARLHKVEPKQIAMWNKMRLSDALKPGQKLTIRGPHSSDNASLAALSNPFQSYIVQKGDSLSQIARKFNISVEDIKRLNPQSAAKLQPGQKLKLKL